MDSLNIAVLQLVSGEDIKSNSQQIINLLNRLDKDKPIDMVCLPENSLYNKISKSNAGFKIDDPSFSELQNWVDNHKVVINLGAVPLLKGNKIYNSTVLLSPGKPAESLYDKIHLFDITIGDLIIKESSQFAPGSRPATKDFLSWKLGFSICYDLRFSELFLHYHKQDVDIIFVPAAFTRHTGRAHWETLLRARAIENQCYIIAPAQTGEATNGFNQRLSFGHSMVIDPWGKVLLNIKGAEPAIEVISLSKSVLMKTRQNMPIAQHRRL